MNENGEPNLELLRELPQEDIKDVCFRALNLIECNREYLEHHIMRGGADKEALEALEDIQVACARLDKALDELMRLLSCISGDAAPKCDAFDIGALTAEMAAKADEIQKKLGVEMSSTVAADAEMCWVRADSVWIKQICMHLLSNAMHACDRGGHIELRLARKGEQVCFSVLDDGCGMPKNQYEASSENRRRFMGGAKAGLLLCREYCRIMGWELEFKRRRGGGTEARLVLPACNRIAPEGNLVLRSGGDDEDNVNLYLKSLFDREVEITD